VEVIGQKVELYLDAIKSWVNGKILELKNPSSTRPWQHVLEPLSGYILLAANLMSSPNLHGEAFNFGPSSDQNYCVKDVIEEVAKGWPKARWKNKTSKNTFYEAGLLKLNCDKALHFLNWKPSLNFQETIKLTSEWYKAYYNQNGNKKVITKNQIKKYINIFNN